MDRGSLGWFLLAGQANGPLTPGLSWELERHVDRTEKREFVAGLHQALSDTSMIVVAHNTGLTVAEATELRRRMRTAGVTFKVAKNRLAHLALEGTQFGGLKPLLKGPTALAWSTDAVAAAKATVEFARTNEKLVLIGGALGSQTLDASAVRALAELPSLDALRARIVGMIATPATRVAGVLQGSAGQLARVFGAFAKKSEEGETSAAAWAPRSSSKVYPGTKLTGQARRATPCTKLIND
jgi:large subunit ribosomal protein L10